MWSNNSSSETGIYDATIKELFRCGAATAAAIQGICDAAIKELFRCGAAIAAARQGSVMPL